MSILSALALAVSIVQAAPQAKKAPRPSPTGAWTVEKSASKMDDSQTVILTLRARNTITAWPRTTTTPSLILRCKEGDVDAFIHFGARAAVEGGSGTATLMLRFDTKPALSMVTSGSTDGLAYFIPAAKTFIADAVATEKLLVRFTPFNSSPQETLFVLSGLKQAVLPLQRACQWDPVAEATVKAADASTAAKALEHGRPENIRALLDQTEPTERRLVAARALTAGSATHADAVVALTKALLTDPSPDVRMTCATRLGDVGAGNPDVANALREAAAREDDALVANAMARALRLVETEQLQRKED